MPRQALQLCSQKAALAAVAAVAVVGEVAAVAVVGEVAGLALGPTRPCLPHPVAECPPASTS